MFTFKKKGDGFTLEHVNVVSLKRMPIKNLVLNIEFLGNEIS